MLLESLEKQLGKDGLRVLMSRLGEEVASQLQAQVAGSSLPEKVQQAAKLMNELACQAETALTGEELPGSPGAGAGFEPATFG